MNNPDEFSDITIEPSFDENGGFNVYGHEDSSVLAGQNKRVFLDHFETIVQAQAEYPKAEVIGHSTKTSIQIPETPPDWFDPMDAGEYWHEDDY